MSQTLCNYIIDFFLEQPLRCTQAVHVKKNLFLTDQMNTDDIVLLADSAKAVQYALNNIDHFVKVTGLRINA